jgi:hypothetical protein
MRKEYSYIPVCPEIAGGEGRRPKEDQRLIAPSASPGALS